MSEALWLPSLSSSDGNWEGRNWSSAIGTAQSHNRRWEWTDHTYSPYNVASMCALYAGVMKHWDSIRPQRKPHWLFCSCVAVGTTGLGDSLSFFQSAIWFSSARERKRRRECVLILCMCMCKHAPLEAKVWGQITFSITLTLFFKAGSLHWTWSLPFQQGWPANELSLFHYFGVTDSHNHAWLFA